MVPQSKKKVTGARSRKSRKPTLSRRKPISEKPGINEQHLNFALRGIDIAVFNLDRNLRYTWMYRPQLGYAVEEVIGFTDEQLLPLEDGKIIMDIKRRVLETGQPAHEEVLVHGTDTPRTFDLVAEPLKDKKGAVIGVTGASIDITERKQAEEKILRLNRLYVTISQINQTIVRVRDRGTLFQEICDVAVEHGNFRMAWIGLIDEKDGLVKPAFFAGEEQGYLENIQVNYHDTDLGRGPTGTAIREERCIICQDIATDPRMEPWRAAALQRGYRSSAAVPFQQGGHVIGALTVYAAKSRDFNPEDEKLLDEIGQDISFALDVMQAEQQRRQAQMDLQKTEEKYHAIFSEAIEGVFQSTPEGKFLTANPALAHMWGYESPEELISNVREIGEQIYVDRHRRDEFSKLIQENGQVYGFEYQVRRKDGHMMWVSENARAVRDANGNLLYYEGHIEDITKRRQAEDLLRENEGKYRLVFENAPVGILLVNKQGRILEVNPSALQILGSPSAEATKSINILSFEPLIAAGIAADFQKVVDTGQSALVEHPYTTKWGKSIQMFMRFTPLFGPDGQVEQIQIILEDITERKKAQGALLESEEKFRKAFVTSPDAININRLEDGMYVSVNSGFIQIMGYTDAEVVGKTSHELQIWVDPNDRQRMVNGLKESREVKNLEARFRKKNGEIRYGLMSASIIELGGIPHVLSITRDITERKHAEDESRQLKEFSESIIQNMAEGIVVEDENGYFTFTNPTAATMLGRRPEELLGKHWTEVFPPDQFSLVKEADQRRKAGKTDQYEAELLHTSGRRINILVSGSPRFDNGRFLGTMAVFTDITERKQAEEKIRRQVERLTAIKSIDHIITSSFDLKVSLGMLLTQAINQLKVDAADILILDPTLNLLEFQAGRGFYTQGIEKSQVRMGEGYAGRAAMERRSLHVEDLKAGSGSQVFDNFLAFEGFESYYCVPLLARGHVKGVMEIFKRSSFHPDPDWLDFLETLAQQAAIAVDNIELFENLQRSNHELILAYDATIEGWSRAMDLRDKETQGHTQRVTEMSVELAKILGIADDHLMRVRWGALLHDIGKIGVPDEILHKPDTLTEEEWKVVRQHPLLAYEMLSPIHYLRSALDIPYCHHEKWDGTGYPRRLKGDQIPLSARIFSVVDVWDALTSDRPYRKAWSKEKTRQYIFESSGTFFDPMVVKVFLESGLTERY